MTSLPAFAGTIEGLHQALTARHFDALVLFDPTGREIVRAGGRDLPPLRVVVDVEPAVVGLPAGVRARVATLAAYEAVFGHVALVRRRGTPDAEAERAARAVAGYLERIATLDYELDNLSRELSETYDAIHLLFDVTGASARCGSAEELANALLDQLARHVRCRAAALLLAPLGDAKGEARSQSITVRVVATRGELVGLAPGATVVRSGAVAQWLAASSSFVIDETSAFRAAHANDVVASNARRSLLVAPLRVQERVVGAVVLFDRLERDHFDSRDRKLVDAVAAHAGAMTSGLRTAELSKELEIGRRIQQSLLPDHLPVVAGLELAGRCSMARAMGGDFYDAVATREGELRAVIADVSGHDLGAALFMAAARAQFRNELLGRRRPGVLATRMNALLHPDLARAGLFLTYFVAQLDRTAGLLRWAAGGHNPPLLLPHGESQARQLEATGVPAGFVPNARLRERSCRVQPGDLLLIYTDGWTEAMATDGTMYGEERLGEALARHRDRPADEVLARIEEEISEFRGGAAATDDGTALLVKVEPAVAPKQ